MKTFEIDGKKFILNKIKEPKNGEFKMELVPFDEEKYNTILVKIVDKLSEEIDNKELLRQVFSKWEYAEILKLHKNLFKKKLKPKAKGGCYGIQVGKEFVEVTS